MKGVIPTFVYGRRCVYPWKKYSSLLYLFVFLFIQTVFALWMNSYSDTCGRHEPHEFMGRQEMTSVIVLQGRKYRRLPWGSDLQAAKQVWAIFMWTKALIVRGMCKQSGHCTTLFCWWLRLCHLSILPRATK